MDEKTQPEEDDAMRAVRVGYAVLDEAEINPEFARLLNEVLDRQVLDAHERASMGLPPLKAGTVLEFEAPAEGQKD